MFHFSDMLLILALLLLFMSPVHCLQGSLMIRLGTRLNTLTSRNAFLNLSPQKPCAATSSLAPSSTFVDSWTSLHRTGFAGVAQWIPCDTPLWGGMLLGLSPHCAWWKGTLQLGRTECAQCWTGVCSCSETASSQVANHTGETRHL